MGTDKIELTLHKAFLHAIHRKVANKALGYESVEDFIIDCVRQRM